MRVAVQFGRQHAELEVDPAQLVQPPLTVAASDADPATALTRALEQPLGYPALRRALIPDDQITILVDERLPHLSSLLIALLDHILSAGVAASSITLLCQTSSHGQPWIEDLPERLEEVRLEIHDPNAREKLAYVATTHDEKPLYLNRSAVDAGQLVILSGRRYDALLGYAGGEGALYPAFSDAATRQQASSQWTLKPPGDKPRAARAVATEAVWLSGAPFFVQVIEGLGDSIAAVVTGGADSCAAGIQSLNDRWRRPVLRSAQTVVATVSGASTHHGLEDLAAALVCASRVVAPHGRIVILSEIGLPLTGGLELLRGAEDPSEALRRVKEAKNFDMQAAWQWATVAQENQIFLLSHLDADLAEELFVIPLTSLDEVQRLVSASESCLILNDAHKTLALIE